MRSQRIEFEILLNTRDLGGMIGAEGKRVLPGKLFRSGHLSAANSADQKKLAGLIGTSIDFRTVRECQEKPEPSIPGIDYLHIPIFDEGRAGVTRDEDSFAEVREKMMNDERIALNYMTRTYEEFITNDHSVSQYERFVRILLEDHPKGVLWHCTAGKDRAGFAAIIVQELLGISREDIKEDYMYTNVCLEPEIKILSDMVLANSNIHPEKGVKAINYVFAANMEYFHTAYDTIEKHFGTFQNYIREALHITSAEQQLFRQKYLEK